MTAGTDGMRRPPAIVLGGDANAVSVARSLSRHGVQVHAVNHPGTYIEHSRAAHWIPLAGNTGPVGWERFLLGIESEYLRGAVLMACSDEAIELVVRNHNALAAKFRLEPSANDVKRILLDKLETYRAASEADIPTPRFWHFATIAALQEAADTLPYPVIIKPLHSHDFEALGRKYLYAERREDLLTQFGAVMGDGIRTVVMEFIPGADDQLCSYNAWIGPDREPRLQFTKRIIRRHPANMGIACAHVTDWNPEVAELGLRFFRHVGLVGFGNVEFKRDARDDRLKIIECNARYTASDCLAVASGVEFGWFSYLWTIGERPPAEHGYRTGRRLWLPIEDVKAMRALRAEGRLGLGDWLKSLRPPVMTPLFHWRDPGPSLHALGARFGGAARKAAPKPAARAADPAR